MKILQPKDVIITLLLLSTLGCSQTDPPAAVSTPSVSVETADSQTKTDPAAVQVQANESRGHSGVTVGADGVEVHTGANHAGADVSISAAGISVETENGDSVKIGENVSMGSDVEISSGGIKVSGGDVEVEITDSSQSAGQIVVTGMSEDRKIDGEGKDIVISGASNDVTISGRCSSLVVSGASNDVQLESSQKIVVTGATNDVTYTSGTPEVVDTGVNNTIVKK